MDSDRQTTGHHRPLTQRVEGATAPTGRDWCRTSPATVGREVELDLIESALAGLRRREGRTVFLLGEAGIGKSRLADECARRAGVPVLRGRGSRSRAGIPFHPFAEALASRFRVGGPPQEKELAPYRPVLARLIPEWRRWYPAAVPGSLVDLGEALLRVLAVLGQDDGCLLVLEDLHDADSETVAVLEYLIDNLAGLPVMLLATMRPDPGSALDLLRAADRRRAATVADLQPLTEPQVVAIAAGYLGIPADEVPEPVVARLTEYGNGNPYLVEELLADLIGSGLLLRRHPAGWCTSGDLSTTFPATIVQFSGQRLDQLDPRVREDVLIAASLGTRFSLTVLQTVTGHDAPTLFAHLGSAAAAGLIVPDPASPDHYTFRHGFTAQALLAGISPAEHAALARHAATTLQQADPALPGSLCQLVAELRMAAADPTGAALLYAEAGNRALADGLPGTAVQLLERAQGLAAAADRTAVTESLVLALAEARRLDHAFALAETLPMAGATMLSTERRVALHTRLAWAAVVDEHRTHTVTQVAAARALLHDGGTPEQAAALMVIEGQLALLPGQEQPSFDPIRSAREAAETAERAGLPVLACQAWQLLATGPPRPPNSRPWRPGTPSTPTPSTSRGSSPLGLWLVVASHIKIPIWDTARTRRVTAQTRPTTR